MSEPKPRSMSDFMSRVEGRRGDGGGRGAGRRQGD